MFGHNERGIFSYIDKFFVRLFDGTSLSVTSVMLGASAFKFLI